MINKKVLEMHPLGVVRQRCTKHRRGMLHHHDNTTLCEIMISSRRMRNNLLHEMLLRLKHACTCRKARARIRDASCCTT